MWRSVLISAYTEKTRGSASLELRFQRFHAHRTLSHVRRFDSCAIEPQAQAIQPGGVLTLLLIQAKAIAHGRRARRACVAADAAVRFLVRLRN